MSPIRTRRTRRLAVAASISAAALGLAGCGLTSSGAESSHDLTIVSYGGGYQDAQAKALFDPFAAANPTINVVQDSPTDVSKLQAMVEAGKPQWDVALVANDFGNDSQGKWLMPIDYNIVDKGALLPGYAGKYRVGADVEGTVVAYRKDKVSQAPRTWADFFDTKKFPGKRAVNKYAAGGILEAALLADGVKPADLYPLDVVRALKKLDTIKDDIVWWDTAAQSQQLLESGEAAMGLVWIGRATDAAKTAPVAIDWNAWLSQDGFWVVPKGVKDPKAAMEFIAFATSEKPQQKLSSLLPYGPVNAVAAKSPEVAANPDRPSNHLDTQVHMNDDWWAQNVQDVNEKFNAWLLK